MELFFPVFLLMFHTLIVAATMGYKRYSAVSSGEVSPSYYEVYVGEEPPQLRVFTRHLINLLEVPILFYLGTIIAFVTGQQSVLILSLAWLYVGLRLVHSFIHLGSNVVLLRFKVFVASMLVLTAFLATVLYGLAIA